MKADNSKPKARPSRPDGKDESEAVRKEPEINRLHKETRELRIIIGELVLKLWRRTKQPFWESTTLGI